MSETELITLPNGLKFKISKQDHSGDEEFLLNKQISGEEYTPEGFDIAPSDTIIDIGAHIGRFTIYAAYTASNGNVYAFEPQPENFHRLQENIGLNKLTNIHLSSKAVADSYKTITLHTNKDSARSSIYGASETSVKIDCLPLSEVFEKNKINRCNFLKLDCEGAEYEILFALPMHYFDIIDKIALEYHDHLSTGKKMPDLARLLSSQGYILHSRPGAFYTGLLFARKTDFNRRILLFMNFIRLFCFDLSIFCIKLIFKRLPKLFKNQGN